MPNWCTNYLVITGARDDRERFAEAVIAFPDEDEKAQILAEERRYAERPFVIGGMLRDHMRDKALDALPEDQRAAEEERLRRKEAISAAASHVESAGVILENPHPTPEEYVHATEERPRNGLWPLERVQECGPWDEILAEVDARRERLEVSRRRKREEIGLQYFDEDGIQARWLSFGALDPLPGTGADSTAVVLGQADRWGTKWEPQEPEREMTDDALIYRFNTAWTPPDRWLMRIARWYPELTFRLAAEEADSDIARVIVIQGGDVTVDDSEMDHSGGWYAGAAAFFSRHGFEDMAERMRERASEYEDDE